MIRQQLIEQLTREIMNYDAEYRREDAAGGIGVSRTALDIGRGERAKHVPRSRSDVALQARPGGTSVLRLSVFQGSAPRGCDPPKGSTPPPKLDRPVGSLAAGVLAMANAESECDWRDLVRLAWEPAASLRCGGRLQVAVGC